VARYRILVVDDNRDSAESLALLLKYMGHETHIALDGAQAVESAASVRPDVVLLDLGMPRVNGYDACRQIRAESWSQGMLLIAQTGWGQDEDRRRTEEAGFDGHLVKPIDPDALLALVASLSAVGPRPAGASVGMGPEPSDVGTGRPSARKTRSS
jgi:CheY-like chemotaxis protein